MGAVLGVYAPKVPGFLLNFPIRAQKLPKLRAFIDAARSLPWAQEPEGRSRPAWS